ncbi:hypothetical protein RhiirA4_429590, partial [Rhizophagus irregularis]
TVNNVEKLDVPKISNCTSSELSGGGSSGTLLSHGTEAIEDNTQFQVQEGITNPIVDSKIPRDIKTVNQVNDQNKSAVDPKIVTEFVQGLLEELLSPDDQLQDMKFSPSRTLIPGSISIKKLANSFCQANVARNKSITAKRSEITLWCLFSKKFEDKVVELRSGDKKLADKTARSQIYAEMKPYLTGVSDGYLRVMTCKARKINKLFGYEYDPVTLKRIDGIAGYMVNRVTCSADRISKLTNPQIEYIIEQVKSKTASSNNKNVASAPIAPDVYFEESEEETNVVTPYPAKTNDDDVYFEESETNEVNTDDESDSDANKSDSDVYFKSDDSDSDDEYDHELHERLTREEMARKAKLEDNKPKVNDADVDFDKIIMEVLEEHETYFDDPAPQSVTTTQIMVRKKNKRRIQSATPASAEKTQSGSLIVTATELQELVRQGLVVDEVHEVLEYDRKNMPWIDNFVRASTELENQCNDPREKAYHGSLQ